MTRMRSRVRDDNERQISGEDAVGTLKNGYICKVPLPQAPQIQHPSHASHIATEIRNTCYSPQVTYSHVE